MIGVLDRRRAERRGVTQSFIVIHAMTLSAPPAVDHLTATLR
ncbi:hypothetical protein RB196_08590 [Streptomyces sp. PmtA]